MTATKRLTLAGAVLALLILGAAGGGAFLLYDAAFQEQRRLLLSNVRSHGALIQAVARFDVQHSPDYPAPFPGITEGGHAATLDQVRAAFAHAGGPSHTGELVLGTRHNGDLSILLHQRPHQHTDTESHPLKQHVVGKERAEPMQRALNGETGTMVGKDYEGRTVLAAHQPLPEVGWGLVAKRELAAIRAPYVRAGLIAGALGLVLVGIGGGLFHAATSPVLRRLRRSESQWERLFQSAGEGIAATDLQGRIQLANPQARHLFGLAPDTPVEGRPLFDFLPAETHNQFQERLREREEGRGEVYELTLELQETERTLRFHATPLPGPDGQPEGSLTLIEDVTEQRQAERERDRQRQLLNQVLDTLPVGVWIVDASGQFIRHNPAGEAIWRGAHYEGGQAAYAEYKGWWADTGKEIAPEEWAVARAVNHGETSLNEVIDIQCFDGTIRTILNSAVPLFGEDGSIRGAIIVNQDITESRQAEAEQRILSDAIHQTADAVFLMDPGGRIEYANPAFRQITGYDPETARGHRPEKLLDAGRMPEGFHDRKWDTVANGGIFRDVVLNRARDGQLFHWEETLSPILGQDGTVIRVVGTATDLSEREALQAQLHHASHYDALTELPNRLSLMEHLETLLARVQWHQRLTALALLDVDDFSLINDSFGHDMGDKLLKALGERLTSNVRQGDMIARTGDDGFGVILDQIAEREDVPGVIEKLWTELSRPFEIAGQQITLTLSMGVALAPEDATEAQGLYHHADAALAQAKRSPQQAYRFYAEELGEWARRRLAIEQGLRRALEEDAFELNFQPQVSLADGRLRGLEALLRWSHPEWGPVSPTEFIPVAEQSRLILPIGDWVLNRALDQLAEWRAMGLSPGLVSINLSPVQLAAPDLATKVEQALKRTGVDPAMLELEVTETALMTHVETAAAHLSTLSRLGVRLAVDDFGTGYSSLAYLSELPLNTLKIDRSFVANLDSESPKPSIVLLVLSLAHALGLEVVGEGVETEDQLAFLQRNGCDAVQGFLLSRPATAAAVPGLLDEGRWLASSGQNPESR